MNKILLPLLSSVLLLGTIACNNAAKTSSSAPDSTAQSPSPTLDKNTAQANQNNATDETRRRQLNSDVRATEQRSQGLNSGNKTDADLKNQVRSKLQANLPATALAIEAKDGTVKVTGTVVAQDQVAKIEPLAKQIKGVKQVEVNVKVDPNAKPAAPNPDTKNPIPDQTGK